jgi:hypothetical protein
MAAALGCRQGNTLGNTNKVITGGSLHVLVCGGSKVGVGMVVIIQQLPPGCVLLPPCAAAFLPRLPLAPCYMPSTYGR